ncbi:MAG: hypothetical protein QOC57_1386 [Ilumatobacteraceae bacterium]|jgi:hypothetical protein
MPAQRPDEQGRTLMRMILQRDDLMIPTKVSYLMADLIPHAELRICLGGWIS